MNTVTPSNSSPFFSEPSKTPERPQRKRNLSKPQSPKGKRQKLFEKIKWTQSPLQTNLSLCGLTKQLGNMEIEKKNPCIKRCLPIAGKTSKERSFSWDLPDRQSTFPAKESPLPLQLKR